ncbi:FYVE-type zinc finger-containing protein [Reticulomyxa filosa]|uniref:FYVE-type zinc finger-containing protein n=1 Tax=Reticulomyxa filosa TaxID=46433 RepID=X6N9T0_RETFI|nr:FYVE-type zinc finger-containing protein [Reticulomyxa filosa]|eukprot:ETO23050.1 FYVE-type zinc finger-containing protein [Reticulomyxa filosa]
MRQAYKATHLEHVWIGVFEESLAECDEEKEVSCEYLINNYLRPYFLRHPTEIVKSGIHWQIKNVHFKAYDCYPPMGKINEETKYHLEDESVSGRKEIKKLHFRWIECVRIQPVMESLKHQKNAAPNSDEKNDGTATTIMAEVMREEHLFHNHIKHFLRGRATVRKETKAITSIAESPRKAPKKYLNKICMPAQANDVYHNSSPNNNNNNNNNNHYHHHQNNILSSNPSTIGNGGSENDITAEQNENKSERTESKQDVDNDNKKQEEKVETDNSVAITSENNDEQIWIKRHVLMGEVFTHEGVQFRVMSCEPSDGMIRSESTIDCNGSPLKDLSSVSIRVVQDTLPEAHKTVSARRFRELYLDPYFKGRNRVVEGKEELVLCNGVRAIVMDCRPYPFGVVTLLTHVEEMRPSFNAEQFRQYQEQQDLEFAQRLQLQESDEERKEEEEEEEEEEEDNDDSESIADVIVPHHPHLPQFTQIVVPIRGNHQSVHDLLDRLSFSFVYIVFENNLFCFVFDGNLKKKKNSLARGQLVPDIPGNENIPLNPGQDRVPLGFFQFLQRIQASQPYQNPNALPKRILDRLPIFEYHPTPDKDKSDTTEDKTCRSFANFCFVFILIKITIQYNTIQYTVCLVEFEKGDQLRLIPCFHRYHKECIDRWLQISRKCPFCKTDISQSLDTSSD